MNQHGWEKIILLLDLTNIIVLYIFSFCSNNRGYIHETEAEFDGTETNPTAL